MDKMDNTAINKYPLLKLKQFSKMTRKLSFLEDEK